MEVLGPLGIDLYYLKGGITGQRPKPIGIKAPAVKRVTVFWPILWSLRNSNHVVAACGEALDKSNTGQGKTPLGPSVYSTKSCLICPST